jgi:hypothetical protein
LIGAGDDGAILPTSEFVVDEPGIELSARPSHVISMIPGIRDLGIWANQLDYISASNGLRVEAKAVVLHRVNTLRFLLRLGARQRESDVLEQLNRIKHLYPDATHSVLAHSYGTEMLSRVISRVHGDYAAIFLCGAVAKRDMAVHYLNKCGKKDNIINDCSSMDKWPVLAEIINRKSYEATGTYGFRVAHVKDRYFSCKHGGYLEWSHFEKYVMPVVLRNRYVFGEPPKVGISTNTIPYLRRFIIVLLIAALAVVVYSVV